MTVKRLNILGVGPFSRLDEIMNRRGKPHQFFRQTRILSNPIKPCKDLLLVFLTSGDVFSGEENEEEDQIRRVSHKGVKRGIGISIKGSARIDGNTIQPRRKVRKWLFI